MGAEEEGGVDAQGNGLARQAGAHPFQLTTSLQLNAGPVLQGGSTVTTTSARPAATRRATSASRCPLGLVGDPSPIPICSFAEFTHDRRY